MDELNNIFKTKAGGGKGKGRGRGGGEGEVDEVKEAFEGLFPFGQYIILTPSLLGQVYLFYYYLEFMLFFFVLLPIFSFPPPLNIYNNTLL